MTAEEAVVYLRLDAREGDPMERLRNLIRRQGLPVSTRGHLRLFRRSKLDAWLDGEETGKTKNPARLVARKGLKTT
jgi:hypothetical protein